MDAFDRYMDAVAVVAANARLVVADGLCTDRYLVAAVEAMEAAKTAWEEEAAAAADPAPATSVGQAGRSARSG